MSNARYPLPDKTTQTPAVYTAAVANGMLAIETFFSGTADPSSGHSWDQTQLGIVWKDTTTPSSPIWKEWALLTTGPDAYGWRFLSFRKVRYLTTPSAAVTFTHASPQSSAVPFESISISALLDTVQDAGDVLHVVSEAILRVRFRAGAAETLGDADGYISFRATGATAEQQLLAPRDGGLGGRWEERQVTVPLDSTGHFDVAVSVGGGTPAFEFEATIVGFQEPCA